MMHSLQEPASPALTNPDMILPRYDEARSSRTVYRPTGLQESSNGSAEPSPDLRGLWNQSRGEETQIVGKPLASSPMTLPGRILRAGTMSSPIPERYWDDDETTDGRRTPSIFEGDDNEEGDAYAAMSRRAEAILANAKLRLTVGLGLLQSRLM